MYSVIMGNAGTAARVATPHEMNAEMGSVLAQINGGIDGENLADGAVSSGDVGVDELHALTFDEHESEITITLADSIHPGALQPMPTDLSNDWQLFVSTEEDAVMHVILSGWVAHSSLLVPANVHLAVELDGLIIGRLDSVNRQTACPFEIECQIDVPPGEHIIRFLYGYVLTISPGGSVDITFGERSAVIRTVYR